MHQIGRHRSQLEERHKAPQEWYLTTDSSQIVCKTDQEEREQLTRYCACEVKKGSIWMTEKTE